MQDDYCRICQKNEPEKISLKVEKGTVVDFAVSCTFCSTSYRSKGPMRPLSPTHLSDIAGDYSLSPEVLERFKFLGLVVPAPPVPVPEEKEEPEEKEKEEPEEKKKHARPIPTRGRPRKYTREIVMVLVGAKIPAGVKAKLQRQAKKQRISLSDIIRQKLST